MKQFLTIFIFSLLTTTYANAQLTGMKISNLCRVESIKEACRHVSLQNQISDARGECKATFSRAATKKAACDKLEELEKEFNDNLIKLKCQQGELSGEDCSE